MNYIASPFLRPINYACKWAFLSHNAIRDRRKDLLILCCQLSQLLVYINRYTALEFSYKYYNNILLTSFFHQDLNLQFSHNCEHLVAFQINETVKLKLPINPMERQACWNWQFPPPLKLFSGGHTINFPVKHLRRKKGRKSSSYEPLFSSSWAFYFYDGGN